MMKRRALFLIAILTLVWFLAHSAFTVWDGLHDEFQAADAAIVLGNRVQQNGQPSPVLKSRLDTVLTLYRVGTVKKVIVSGGIGREGFDEAKVMQNYLTEQGVPVENILADHEGNNTFLTAQHTQQLMRQEQLHSIIIVTHYYHISRVRLALERFGVRNIYAVHAEAPFNFGNLWEIAREFFAYYYYLVRSYT